MTRRDDRLALIVLLVGACIIGLAPILVRLSAAGPVASAFWRIAFSIPLLGVLAAIEPRGEGGGKIPPAALWAGVAFAGDLAFWHFGIGLTSVANATVLPNLTPIIVTAVAWGLFGQKPKAAFVAALVLAVGGAVLMGLARNGGVTAGQAGRDPHLGDALCALTACWYAAYFLLVRSARATAGAAKVMLVSSLVSAPILLVTALVMGQSLAPATLAGWAACVGLGVVHVTGQGAIAWSLGRLPATLTAVVVLVQPVVAGLIGWVLFAEALSPLQGVGAAIALAGVALAQIANARGAARPA